MRDEQVSGPGLQGLLVTGTRIGLRLWIGVLFRVVREGGETVLCRVQGAALREMQEELRRLRARGVSRLFQGMFGVQEGHLLAMPTEQGEDDGRDCEMRRVWARTMQGVQTRLQLVQLETV